MRTKSRPTGAIRRCSDHGRRFAAAIVIALAGACRPSSEPFVPGLYRLITVNGKTLPVDQGRGPFPQYGPDTIPFTANCHLLIAKGQLQLDESNRVFKLVYSTTSSCTGKVMSGMTLDGSYTTEVTQLSFRVPAAVPPDDTFDGQMIGDRIFVRFVDMTMVFAAH